ncbi:MAG TPA: hypothetical protein VGM84_19680 [Steroidobacteraceae bacterium]|jgi:hypothetical protein
MLPAILLVANLHAVSDTVGIRELLRESIASVVQMVARSNEWARSTEYFVVNVPTFQRLVGADTSDTAGWRVIMDSLGTRGRADEGYCSAPRDHVCPHIWATAMIRNRNGYQITIMVDYNTPGAQGLRPRAQFMEFKVNVTAIGDKFRLDSVVPGLIS